MESDEPSLVPQWLKGGASASSAFSSSHANNSNGNGSAGLRDLNLSTKRHIPDWEDRHFSDRNFRPQNFRHSDTAKRASDDKHWKTHSEPFVGRPARHSRSNSFSDDRHNNNAAGSDHRRGSRGFGAGVRGRDDLNGGYDNGDAARDAGYRSSSHEDSNLGYGARNAFDRNFPSLGEQRPPSGATPPAYRHSTTGFLAAKATGNWTSKLADSPSPTNPSHPGPSLAPAASAPLPSPAAAPTPAPTQAPAPKMSEALQQTLTSRATSADRQRLDQLVAKQSRTLVPVLATSSKSRTSASTPSSKFLAPLRLDPTKPINGRAPAPSPFAAPKPAPAAALQRAHSASAAATGGSAPPAAAPTAVPNGMVSLRPAGSGKVLERTSFFDSLRRKPSADPTAAKAAAAAAATAPAAAAAAGMNGSTAAAAANNGSGAAAAQGLQQPPSEQQQQQAGEGGAAAAAAPQGGGGGELKGLAKLRSLAEAEEEAFLRSLGWEEPQDGEDEGLTEEEIAAFLAAEEQRQKATASAAAQGQAQGRRGGGGGSAPRLVVGGKAVGLRWAGGLAVFEPSSYNSQTTFESDTDSDSDC